jgi:aryl-alcohol dehydrogenase-like predicted oxidoreductase
MTPNICHMQRESQIRTLGNPESKWPQHALTGPIASATSAAQVHDLVAAAELALTADDLALLNAASA